MIRRTAMITAGSIAGVVLAGGIAAGANIGILRAADDSPLGELSAQTPMAALATEATSLPTPSEPVAVETVTVDTPAADSAAPDVSSTVVVDEAGELDLVATQNGLSVAAVRPNAGWSWEQVSSDGRDLVVVFTSDGQRLEVTAHHGADDGIGASVERVAAGVTTSLPVNQPPGSQQPVTQPHDEDGYSDDGYSDDEDEEDGAEDDSGHEDDDREGSGHLGGDDDD